MKKEILALSLLLTIGAAGGKPRNETCRNIEQLTSSKTEAAANFQAPAKALNPGEKIFKDKGCTVCHQVSTKLGGPPLKTIAAAYANNKKGLVAFLKDTGKPIVDPGQASVMHPQIAITKSLQPNELDALVNYILSAK